MKKTLEKARQVAAERETTVNELVRDYIESMASEEAARTERRKETSGFLGELRRRAKTKVGPVNWSHDDIYKR